MSCQVKGCQASIEYDIPAKLCKRHWMLWFCSDEADANIALEKILANQKVKLQICPLCLETAIVCVCGEDTDVQL